MNGSGVAIGAGAAVCSEVVTGQSATFHSGWPGITLGLEWGEWRRILRRLRAWSSLRCLRNRPGKRWWRPWRLSPQRWNDDRASVCTTCPLRRRPGQYPLPQSDWR